MTTADRYTFAHTCHTLGTQATGPSCIGAGKKRRAYARFVFGQLKSFTQTQVLLTGLRNMPR